MLVEGLELRGSNLPSSATPAARRLEREKWIDGSETPRDMELCKGGPPVNTTRCSGLWDWKYCAGLLVNSLHQDSIELLHIC